MKLLREKERHDAEHQRVQEELEKHEAELVDMATRLVRLEAEVGIFRPIFIHDEDKGLP